MADVKVPSKNRKILLKLLVTLAEMSWNFKFVLAEFAHSLKPCLHRKRMAHALIATANKSAQLSLAT